MKGNHVLDSTPLPEADRDHFDRQGYLIVRQALDEAKVARLLAAGDRLLASDLQVNLPAILGESPLQCREALVRGGRTFA